MPDIDDAKLWLMARLNSMANSRALDVAGDRGRVWPCRVVSVDNQIVTVALDVASPYAALPTIAVPKLESPYVMTPTQPGDEGLLVSADVFLDHAIGSSSTPPAQSSTGNLSALAFLPLATVAQVLSPIGYVVVTGVDGVEITTKSGSASVTLSQDSITLSRGSTSMLLSSSGITINGDVTVNGTVSSNGVVLSTHTHIGVQPGTGTSGPPTQ